MTTYYTNEAAFDLPDMGFVDRTVTLLQAESPGGGEIALLLQRFPLPVGKSLRDVVKTHLGQSTRSLRAYSVIFERDSEVSSAPAIEIAFRWRGEDNMVYTRQAHLVVGTQWLVVAANAPLAERETCDQLLEHVLSTLRVRD